MEPHNRLDYNSEAKATHVKDMGTTCARNLQESQILSTHPPQSIVKVVIGSCIFLLPVFGGIQLVYARPVIGWVSSESDVKMLHPEATTKERANVK